MAWDLQVWDGVSRGRESGLRRRRSKGSHAAVPAGDTMPVRAGRERIVATTAATLAEEYG